MKNLKLMVASLGLAGLMFSASACGGSAVKDFEKIVDEICACKDKACAEKAAGKLEKLAEKYGKDKKMSKDDEKKLEALGGKMMECMMKLEGADAPAE